MDEQARKEALARLTKILIPFDRNGIVRTNGAVWLVTAQK
jgi:hypothetical protein